MRSPGLESLGAGQDAERIHRLMLVRPDFRVENLSERLGFTHERVRAGLDELARMALACESRDHPGRFRTVRPEVALNNLLRQQELELAQRLRELADGKAAVAMTVAECTRAYES